MNNNLTPIPQRMWGLRRDRRGYPIPWNVVAGKDGTPIFTVNDQGRHLQALREGRCPICGDKIPFHVKKWFVGGPRSAFDPRGCYIDLPGHYECISYSLQVCPYLSAPRYLGRVDVPNPENLPVPAVIDLTQDPNRPPLFVIQASRKVQILPGPDLLYPYVKPSGDLLGLEYWMHGKKLTPEAGEAIVRTVMGETWKAPKIKRRKKN